MSTHNIQFHDKKKSLNICFLELSEEFRRDKNEFELAMVNEPSMFESSRFDCNRNLNCKKGHLTPLLKAATRMHRAVIVYISINYH